MNVTMKHKPDIGETLERYKMWWNREDFGRCAVSICAWSGEGPPKPDLPAKLEDRWLDFDYLKKHSDHVLGNTAYLAEAVPSANYLYPGNDWIPAYLGCEVELGETTGWTRPIIADGDLSGHDPAALQIDKAGGRWQWSQKFHALQNAWAAGKSFPVVPAMGGCGDTLAAIRTTEKLLFDCADQPGEVRRFEDRLMTLWIETYEHYFQLHKDASFGGSANWMGLWAPGRFYVGQNDFSYMISPEMYEELFLDALKRQVDYLDYSIYHVDGPAAFAHVDLLCSLENLDALQILPGDGKPDPLHYMDVLRKVQSRGKNLHISLPPERVVCALDNLSSKGLFINTWCATPGEGEDLLRLVAKHSRFV